MEQTIQLMGGLAERYGATHTYKNLRTPADGLKLLFINRPELQSELIHAHENGIGYTLVQGAYDLTYDDLHLPIGRKPLILTPIISGSGGGNTSTILIGVGLVAASFLLPGAGLFGTTGLLTGAVTGTFSGLAATSGLAGTLTTVGTALSAIGASLILSGVANIISPMPTIRRARGRGENVNATGPQGVTRATDGVQNYAYTGAVNTAGANGAAVPIVYGKCLIGSHLISVEVESDSRQDIAHPAVAYIRAPGTQTVTVNNETLTDEVILAGGARIRRVSDPNGQIKGNRNGQDYYFDDALTKKMSLSETINITADSSNVGVVTSMRRVVSRKAGNDNSKNYQVVLQLNNGLFDLAGDAGSTKVDGFFSYRIDVVHVISPGDDPVVASVGGTVSGLIEKGTTYTWMHFIRYSEPGDPGDEIKPKIVLTDFRATSGCSLQVIRQGYKTLKTKDDNFTHKDFNI
jgi:predicted phage tail protein